MRIFIRSDWIRLANRCKLLLSKLASSIQDGIILLMPSKKLYANVTIYLDISGFCVIIDMRYVSKEYSNYQYDRKIAYSHCALVLSAVLLLYKRGCQTDTVGHCNGCVTDAPGSYIAWLCRQTKVHVIGMPGSRYDIGNLESYEQVQKEYRGITK